MSVTIERDSDGPDSKVPSGMKLVVVTSPKGGVGKTTIASNLLVRASQCGVRALGIDTDRQASLYKWFETRPVEARTFEVRACPLDRWSGVYDKLTRQVDEGGRLPFDLIVVDTPPSVEDHMLEVRNLLEDADLAVIPTKASGLDLKSTLPWGKTVAGLGVRSVMVLNMINRQATSWRSAKHDIMRARLQVCPEELPNGEDVSRFMDKGFALLDINKVRGDLGARFEAVYDYVAREIGL